MKIHFVDSKPKQYLFDTITTSGINIVHNKELDALKNCLLKKNSEKSVEGFFVVLNEIPINKYERDGFINLEVINHYNSNKKNLTPEWIRCAIWREGDDSGSFFDIVLKKFGKKNKKREHYTDMRKVCSQIINECKNLADGHYDSGLFDAKNIIEKLLTLKSPLCK